ncbi:unnamed protein product [Dracunculus medinensis]|uniref:Peroxidase n=1 Tax=Dracunculus medinensis TaxID=318479 RepID=A0A158Q370_DRAME|nr:unnamed protein product [Dracunculus medinensis]
MKFEIFICLAAIFSTTISCPSKCTCNYAKTDCRGKALRSIPENIPHDTIFLDLRNNRIVKISKKSFAGLQNLRILHVSHNHIRSIDHDAFDAIPSIRRFFAAGNRLQILRSFSSNPLKELNEADFHSNHIRLIHSTFIDNLPNVESINLAQNHLQNLPDNLFQSSIHSINMEGNPVNCDCRWKDYLKELEERFEGSPRCFYPPELQHKHLKKLNENDFKCLPVKISQKNNQTVLGCSEHYGSFIWLYQNKEIVNGDENFKINLNGDLIIINNSISVNYIQCTKFWYTRKQRQAIDISAAPRFTLKPKSRLYREGVIARLDCEVVGNPQPKIQWFRHGKALKRSRKYEMNYEQTNININPFLESDVGIYTCVATNNHGRIEASASLKMVSSTPPEIFEGPMDQIVSAGSTVRFRCLAKAIPRASITWFFDGSEVPTLRGHYYISNDQTELIISGVTKKDDGTISCMAGNTVGSMTANARLVVSGGNRNYIQNFNIHPLWITDDVVRNAAREASENVEKAIQATQRGLNVTSPADLMRWFHFSVPQTSELSRAREIYEESIRLIQKHIEKAVLQFYVTGLILSPNDLSPNVSFDSVLTKSHMDILMQLAGCSGTQNKDPCNDQCYHSRYRTFDGQCNNQVHTMWGASYMRFRRLLQPIYENGFNIPVGWNPTKLYYGFRKPNPRMVSKEVIRTHSITPHEKYSAMLMQWGQFIDHDLDFTATAISRHAYATGAICNNTCENIDPCFNIPLNSDDLKLLKRQRHACIEFERSSAVCGSGETSLIYRNVAYREQMNIITSYIDGSGIYGSRDEDAYELRELHPDRGLLRYDTTSEVGKPYLPFERDSPMDCRRNHSINNPIRCFLAGDYRANEQVGLTAMHTIFLREHNRLATQLNLVNPRLDGETIYQEARKIVGAMLQHITFNDWLPKVLGKAQFDQLIGSYHSYKLDVDASISNAFATAAFRFGHTLINLVLNRLDGEFKPIASGHLPLKDAFFAPEIIFTGEGIDPLIRGLFASPMKKPLPEELLNMHLTEDLFNRAHEVALDLGAINIQRGRDHGLPGYTQYRKWCNLSAVEEWSDLWGIMPPDVIKKLTELYGHPGNIDLFAGGITEIRKDGSLIGPTFSCIIAEQFRRVRDGDRFWYEKNDVFTEAQLNEIKKVTLARIICDNADKIDRIQQDVFIYPGQNKEFYNQCSRLPHLDIRPWQSCCEASCSIADNRYRGFQRRIILYYDEAVKLENAKNATSSPWQNYILLQTKNGIQLPVERYTH